MINVMLIDKLSIGIPQTSRFGWRPGQDGLRGHLFMSVDKRHGIIVFKGTTLFQLGTSPNPDTIEGDRLNVSGGSGGTVLPPHFL